jgi:ABC-type uncharacterized transport system involved in gliding motility auxiliary subunit
MQDRAKAMINFFSMALLLLGILVVVQVIADRHVFRADLTETRRYSLSRKSKEVLALLDAPLFAAAFIGDADPERAALQELFEEFRLACPSFHFEFIDPAKNPDKTRRYGVQSHGTVVLQYKGQRRNVLAAEEETLINAVYRLIDTGSRTIYFSVGHGEKEISGDFKMLGEALEQEGYSLKELSLYSARSIPEGAACLVIAGPQKPFFDLEINLLSKFIDRGGNLILLLDPYVTSGLAKFLSGFGIELLDAAVVDKINQLPGGSMLFPAASQYGTHAITRNLALPCFFPVARPLRVSAEKPANVELDVLVQSAVTAWGETDRAGLLQDRAEFDPDRDFAGPLVLAAVARIAIRQQGIASRIVVFGDSDFAANTYLNLAGNRDLILNAIGWAADMQSGITIRPRVWGDTPIILSQRQLRVVFWISVVFLPLLIVLCGLWVQWRRRGWKE